MKTIRQHLNQCFFPHSKKSIISNPSKNDVESKIVFRNIGGRFQREVIRNTQVFHYNYSFEDCFQETIDLLVSGYRQVNCFEDSHEYQLKITKKGKVFISKTVHALLPDFSDQHNRNKSRLLEYGRAVPVLVDIGVMTSDGKVINSMYNKYRQINRYLELIVDELGDWDHALPLNIIDFGCGNSYLTFVLYHYLKNVLNIEINILGIDAKQDLVDKCTSLANKYGYNHLRFHCGDMTCYSSEKPVDMVVSLHACDTATDHVIHFTVRNNVKYLFAVPCCQHEIANQLKASTPSILTRYGILKERLAAIMTDAIRANILQYFGYGVQVLEFVDLENTSKNVMLRASKRDVSKATRMKCLKEAMTLMSEYHLNPTVAQLLPLSPEGVIVTDEPHSPDEQMDGGR